MLHSLPFLVDTKNGLQNEYRLIHYICRSPKKYPFITKRKIPLCINIQILLSYAAHLQEMRYQTQIHLYCSKIDKNTQTVKISITALSFIIFEMRILISDGLHTYSYNMIPEHDITSYEQVIAVVISLTVNFRGTPVCLLMKRYFSTAIR